MLTTIERILILKEVPMFQELNIDQLRILAEVAQDLEVEKGTIIAHKGSNHDSMYVIVSGQVAIEEVQVRGNNRRSVKRMATIGARDYFGELSIFDKQPFGYDIVAIEPTVLLAIEQQTLTALMRNQPELSRLLLKAMSLRLRHFMAVANERTTSRPRELVDIFDQLL